LSNQTIHTPARFVPLYGVGFARSSGEVSAVSADSPLPMTLSAPADAPAPSEGTASESMVAGPFTPATLTPIVLVLDGEWTGTVQVMRSTDGGSTLHPLTAAGGAWGRFVANACEPVWEESDGSAALYLDIALASGTLDYRLGH
jgi:hypothetical protein